MIIKEIIDSIKEDAVVDYVHICQRSVIVKSKRLGLAYHFQSREEYVNPQEVKPLRGVSAKELSKYALSRNWLQSAIGVAAINSIIPLKKDKFNYGSGSVPLFDKAPGKRVAVVGHFAFVDKLREVAAHLDVLELNPQEGDLPANMAPEVIPKAEIVAITGTTVVNHTIDDLLELAKNAYVILLGPTTPISDIFFKYGVDIVCGSVVEDETGVLDHVQNGGSFRDLPGVKKVMLEKC